jgi:hypothetical protein
VNLDHGAKWVNGGVEVDTMTSPDPRHEFLTTRPGGSLLFEPGQKYRIRYDYTIKGVNVDWTFFHTFEGGSADGQAPRFYEVWQGEPGSKGTREFTVTANRPDAKLLIGIKKGAIRIENLKVGKLAP